MDKIKRRDIKKQKKNPKQTPPPKKKTKAKCLEFTTVNRW